MNVPNSLSLTRICLIPLFVLAYFLPYEWGVYVSVAIFLICCFTDFLDGFIARKYNMVTDLGKLLDPIADKILICAALFCVVATNPLQYCMSFIKTSNNMWLSDFISNAGLIILTVGSILILARELLISAVRQIAASKGKVVQANIFGKIKTITQDVCLPLLLIMNAQAYIDFPEMWVAVMPEPPIVQRTRVFDVIGVIALILFIIAVVLTIVSGVIYLMQNRGVFKQEQSK